MRKSHSLLPFHTCASTAGLAESINIPGRPEAEETLFMPFDGGATFVTGHNNILYVVNCQPVYMCI